MTSLPWASMVAVADAEVGCGLSSCCLVAESVRAYGSIWPSAVLSWEASAESVLSRVAALTGAGNRAWLAARWAAGAWTAHWGACGRGAAGREPAEAAFWGAR